MIKFEDKVGKLLAVYNGKYMYLLAFVLVSMVQPVLISKYLLRTGRFSWLIKSHELSVVLQQR